MDEYLDELHLKIREPGRMPNPDERIYWKDEDGKWVSGFPIIHKEFQLERPTKPRESEGEAL